MWLWELYASTEGNIQLANIMDDEGCIMRFTPFVQLATGGRLLKFDPIEEKLILDSKGRAIKADYDEPGKLYRQYCYLQSSILTVTLFGFLIG